MYVDRTEIINALASDPQLQLREKREFFREGICPDCESKTVWIGKQHPWVLRCDRTVKCEYEETIKERYPHLFENWAERYPCSEKNPNATAQAFMSMKRGLDTPQIRKMYTQGIHKLSTGMAAETVRFEIVPGMTWERLIEDKHIAVDSGKTRIKKQNPAATYSKKGWQPAGQKLNKRDTVYIVEGIFCALSMMLAGHKSIAAFSCSNFPLEIIEANAGKEIKWVLAYDNDIAAHKYLKRYLETLKHIKEDSAVVLSEPGKDWNDAWLAGQLTEKYISECEWNGREFAARTQNEKAYVLYGRRAYTHRVFEFGGFLYSASVDIAALSKLLDGARFEFGFCKTEFDSCAKVVEIGNFSIDFLHIEKDKFTQEQRFFFELLPAFNPRRQLIGLPANAIIEPKSFSNGLLNLSCGSFEGSSGDLRLMRKQWLNRKVTYIETVPFVGYDEGSKSYVFTTCGYHESKYIPANTHGFIDVDGQGIKTTIKSVTLLTSTEHNFNWLPDFIKVFDVNGLCALSFWTASLFTRQIKTALGAMPFLEVTGEKEAGKTTLIRFLWRLLGRDNYEGLDLNVASGVGLARYLSQVSNMPVVLLESDREDTGGQGGRPRNAINWDELKKLTELDGVLRSTGVKTNDSSTNEILFRGAIVITQNETVAGSEALLSRIVHLHCTTAHKKPENRQLADNLKEMRAGQLCGFLHAAITREHAYLECYLNAFKTHRATLSRVAEITSDRCIDFHAQVMASVDALAVVLPSLSHTEITRAHDHLVERAKDRMQRMSADHPLVQKFWDTYDYINRESRRGFSENGSLVVDEEQLNHHSSDNLIAVNLNQFYKLANNHGQERLPLDDLKKHLPKSRKNTFIAYKRVRSRHTDTVGRYWVFEKGLSD